MLNPEMLDPEVAIKWAWAQLSGQDGRERILSGMREKQGKQGNNERQCVLVQRRRTESSMDTKGAKGVG